MKKAMNSKSQRANNVKQFCTVGCGAERTIYKKPSRKEKAKQHLKNRKLQQEEWENRFTEQDKETFKFGLFNVRGFVMIKGFETKEQAEEYLDTNPFYKDVKHRYEIRELLWGI